MKVNKLLKRFLAVALAATLAIPTTMPTTVNAADDKKVICYFSFDDEDGFKYGDYKAEMNWGAWKDNETRPNTTGNSLGLNRGWVAVKDSNGKSPLTNLETCTISYYSKSNCTGFGKGWTFFAERGGIVQTTGGYEHYLGVMDLTDKVEVERYNCNKDKGIERSEKVVATGNFSNNWKKVTVVYAESSTKIYINGFLVDVKTNTHAIMDILGYNSILQLGKANWTASGEFYEGLMDEFTIYNYPQSDEEVKQIYENENKSSTVTISDGWYYVKSISSQKYLTVKDSKAKDGTNVCIRTGKDKDNADQKWYVTNTNDGYITLTSAVGNYMLDVANGNAYNGANIDIHSPNSQDAQKFKAKATTASGLVTISTKTSREICYLDVEGAKAHDGANVQQYAYNGNANQQWKFEAISGSTPAPTAVPTAKPTAKPTATPTAKPTATPTAKPTAIATPTAVPTAKPTAKPTAAPTAKPTAKPTATPTVSSGSSSSTKKATKTVDMSGVSASSEATLLEAGKGLKINVNLPDTIKASEAEITYSAVGSVSVSKNGVVTANKAGAGKVFIRVATSIKSVTKVVRFNVFEVEGASTVKVGKKITFKVKNAGSATWSVNNKKLATISKNGVLKAKKKGTVTVTAIVDGVKVTRKVKIKK